MSYKVTVTPGVRVTKRAIDLLASGLGLAVTLPLYPLIGAAIYAESPGPIFYKQRRAGMLKGVDVVDGIPRPHFVEFDMRKVRTMRVDAEKLYTVRSGKPTDALLELRFSPGVQAYSFTFG